MVVALGMGLLMSGGMISGHAATLAVGESKSATNSPLLEVPIFLSTGGDEPVAAAQFDLEFDSTRLALGSTMPVTAGGAAKAAHKQVLFSQINPGKIRAIVISFDQQCMKSGEVARVLFTRQTGAVAENPSIHLGNIVLSDAKGIKVPCMPKSDGKGENTGIMPKPSFPFPIQMAWFLAGFSILVLGILFSRWTIHLQSRPVCSAKPRR